MKNRVKKLCLWVLVIVGVFGSAVGCVLGAEGAWADPIRQTVKNGDSFIVVENNTVDNKGQEVTITIEKDDGNNNSEETIKVQPSNPNVYKLDDGSKSVLDNLNTTQPGQIIKTIDMTKLNSSGSSDEGLKCDDIADEGVDGKVGAMQWIMCPAMDNTSYTATFLDETVQGLLEVKKDIYSGEVISNAWNFVRNMANIIMIIFLMLVVISQLTGYGIDNYGIKKMLPRLITMAIVINLSLYICQIAVDLSNIFGEGLRDMFGSIGNAVSGGQAEGGSFIVGSIGAMFAAAGSAGSAAISVVTTASALGLSVTAFWAVLIVVILLVLIIIVAVVVLFAMVAIRKIIVIFCVVISPLAFAAFILPNTQNLFKKWWELFKMALLIFPICGAVAGIAAMLKGIARGSGALNWFEIAIVMVLPYLVYFLIPMLLKQAIAAFGKIGGALTSMGTTLKNSGRSIGSAATQGLKNSEWGKRNQMEVARRRASESADRTIRKLDSLKGKRDLNDEETRRLARAHETKRKLGLEDQAARTILAEKDYAGMSQQQIMSEWNAAFDGGDTEKMDALTNVITSKYGPGGASAIAENLAQKKIFGADGKFVVGADGNTNMEKSFTALQANMMQNKALATNMQNKASDAYQMITSGGYGGDNEMRHNLDWHSANNDMATQTKDWATQSSASLRRAAANGGLDQKMAQQILNSNDPAVQSGILSDASKRAVIEAVASGNYSKADMKQVAGGMDTAYVGKTDEQVKAEAYAENARRSNTGSGGNAANNSARNSVDMNSQQRPGDGADGLGE